MVQQGCHLVAEYVSSLHFQIEGMKLKWVQGWKCQELASSLNQLAFEGEQNLSHCQTQNMNLKVDVVLY